MDNKIVKSNVSRIVLAVVCAVLPMGLTACAGSGHSGLDADRAAAVETQWAEREQVRSLVARAMDARRARDYAGAERLVDEALAIRPNDVAARAAKQGFEDTRLLLAARDARDERGRQIARQRVQNIRASTPYSDLQTFPQDWPELTQRRLGNE